MIVLAARPLWWKGLYYGVAPTIEHASVLENIQPGVVVDVGANKGQFSLLCKGLFPDTHIYAFEPLPEPAARYRQLFSGDNAVKLYQVALGLDEADKNIHISSRPDSSSLLPITCKQVNTFPGTACETSLKIKQLALNEILGNNELSVPALLKIDVQGYELEVLKGSEKILKCFSWIYCECSFIELYEGQALAADIIHWLDERGFSLQGVYNTHYDRYGMAVQADFLFNNSNK